MGKRLQCLLVCMLLVALVFTGCSNGQDNTPAPDGTPVGSEAEPAESDSGSGEIVELEFTQWWEPELAEGEFRSLMDQFEEQNPGIKVTLLSGPFASTKEQIIAGAATGTIPDVVGLDGSWVNDFAKQGSIANLSEIMANNGYDGSELSAQVQVDGATYMIPVLNFTYPLFINKEIMAAAGVESVPTTRSEFIEAAKAMTDASNNIYGFCIPLSLEKPNGIQNDIMSWLWASGKHMLKEDGTPDLLSDDVKGMVEFVKGLYDDGVVSPGSFTMKPQDRVEEFTNGRLGMMISSLSHINVVRQGNPDLDFMITSVPVADGYTGESGVTYASWGIGISDKSEHPDEAWKLVEFLMSQDVNANLASMANAFPGNINATPDFAQTDELFSVAFDLYKSGYLVNEFTGLPVSEDLMRSFDEQLQMLIDGQQSVDDMLGATQETWEEALAGDK